MSPEIRNLRSELLLDPSFRAIPVDYGFVSLNYDRAYFRGKALPQRPEDLARPEYARLLVVENPATSSPGLAFLMATVARFGEDGYLDFWARLRDGGVRVAKGWSEAYYTHFTLHGGDRPLVVSYTTSPAAEVYYSEGKYKEPPPGTSSRSSPSSRWSSWASSRGPRTWRPPAASWTGSSPAPCRRTSPRRCGSTPPGGTPACPRSSASPRLPPGPCLDPARMAANRERWIEEWTRVVLQGQDPEAVRAGRR